MTDRERRRVGGDPSTDGSTARRGELVPSACVAVAVIAVVAFASGPAAGLVAGDHPAAGSGDVAASLQAGEAAASVQAGDTAASVQAGDLATSLQAEDNRTVRSGADEFTAITTSQAADGTPDLAATGDGYLLVWGRGSGVDGHDVLWAAREDGNWTEPRPLAEDLGFDPDPAVAYDADADRGIAVWEDAIEEKSDLAPGKITDLFFATYAGGTWSEPKRLTDNEHGDFDPRAVESDGEFLVAWSSIRTDDPFGDGEVNFSVGHATVEGGERGAVGSVAVEAPVWRVSPGEDRPFRMATFTPDAEGERSGTLTVRAGSGTGAFEVVNRHRVTDAGTIALGPDSVAWTTRGDDRVVVRYATDGSVETVPSRLDATGVRGLSIHDVDDSTLITQRARVEGTVNRRTVYAVRHGGEWAFDHEVSFTADGDAVEFSDPSVAANDGEFATALSGRAIESGLPAPDLFAAVHEFRAELATEIHLDADGVEPGDEVRVPYTVRNVGDRDVATTFEVALRTDDGVAARRTVRGLALGDSVEGSFGATVPESGRLSVVADPGGQVPQVTGDLDTATLVVARPDVAIVDVSATRDGNRARVNATLENFGGASADPLEVTLTSGDRQVGTLSLSLAAGERREVSAAVDVGSVADNRIHVDAAAADDLVPANASFGVSPFVADLALYGRQVEFGVRDGDLVATVDVVNHGTGATNFTLLAVGPDGEEVGSVAGTVDSPGRRDLVVETVSLELPPEVAGREVTFVAQADADRGEFDGSVQVSVPALDGIEVTPPTVEFEARGEDGTVTVRVAADRPLDPGGIEVAVDGPGSPDLSGEFEAGDGENVYVARVPVETGGTYRFELVSAPGVAGGDGANGQTASVSLGDDDGDDGDVGGDGGDGTETDGGGLPGFGVVAALAGLLGVLLVAGRRSG